MLGPFTDRALAGFRRIDRLDRSGLRDFRRWLEQTSNLLHLSVLLIVPLLVIVVTTLASAVTRGPIQFCTRAFYSAE